MKPALFPLSLILLTLTAACAETPPAPSPSPTGTSSSPASPAATVVWPILTELQPAQALPGEQVRVMGSGGYLVDSQGGYHESYRTFALYFDGQEVSVVGCYVNWCEGELIVPTSALSGAHQISTEGGSHLAVQVIEALP